MHPFSRFIPIAVALITIAAVLAGVFEVDHLEQERLAQQKRSQTLDQLSIVRANMESALNARVFLGRGLVAYASTHPKITVPEFQHFAAALVRQQSGIRSIQLAKGSIVSHIYPLKGNEAALGLRLMDIPAQRDAVQRAIKSRNTVVAGPVDLVQGGRAFVSRTPIFLSPPGGRPGSGAYWGLATIIIDMAPLLAEAGLGQDLLTLRYALRGRDATGASGKVFWGDPALFEKDSERLDITLPNGSWEIAAMPRKPAGHGSTWLRQVGILLALVAGMLAWFLARNPARLRQLVHQTTGALRQAHADLEIKVAERTSELQVSNDMLKSEITERKHVEDSLHNQLLFTQALFEAIPSPVFFKNKKGVYLGCNQAFETAFGLSRQKINGKTVYDIMPKDLADVYCTMDEALFREPGLQIYESQVGLADGTRRNVIFYKATFTDAGGELNGLVGVILDITERKQMEEALRRAHNELEERVQERTRELSESEARLLKAQKIAHFGNWDWDIVSGRLNWSEESYRIFGLAPQQLGATYEAALELAHPDDRTLIAQSINAALHEEKPYNIEHRIVLPDGAIRHVHEQAEVAFNDAGQPVRMQGTVQDITERKLAEEALRSSEARNRALLEAQPDMMFLLDAEGTFLDYHAPDVGKLLAPPENFVRKNVRDIMPEETIAPLLTAMHKVLSSNELQLLEYQLPVPGGPREFENRMVGCEGNKVICIVRDITERKSTEEKLRRQAQIIDQTHDSVITSDLDGIITFWNNGARQMFGYSEEEVLGKHVSMLDAQPQQQENRRQMFSQLFEQDIYETEISRRRKSGELIHIHLILTLLKDTSNQNIGIVGYSMDITERKRLEQQIIEISEEGQKRIGQELHDGLGQHLTGVAFLVKALQQKLATRFLPEAADTTEIVHFLNQAVTQTRILARGLFPVELENNGLMSALEQLASGIKKLFGISCIFRCKYPVLVDDRITAINLYRIVQEALANAAKHSKASDILIELTAEGHRINLTITDNGIGLNPDDEHQGMGLHIMRYRANMLGASLVIRGAAGGGTEIRVSLNQ